jgi:anti-sigma factor RsiW
MVDAYLDGELTATESADFERALAVCPDCRKRLDSGRSISGLLRDLPAEPAPDLLRARIERELRGIAGRASGAKPVERLRWAAMAASVVAALGLGWLGGTLSGQTGRESDALVASYLRVAMAEHTVDVASSDRHTVKPWYAGRIDYAPPVHDLTARRDRRPQGRGAGLPPQPAQAGAQPVAGRLGREHGDERQPARWFLGRPVAPRRLRIARRVRSCAGRSGLVRDGAR